MDNNNAIDNNSTMHPVHELIAEWKRRKCEDEKEFLHQINDPIHQQRMEFLRGKTVKHETTSA